jgi:tetratricopeptide (TPR) repeat protein
MRHLLLLLILPLLAAAPAKNAAPAKKSSKPAVGEAARKAFVKANALMGDAKTPDDYAAAARYYEEAAASAPAWPDPHFNLAKARELRGEHAAAIESLKKYIALGGADAREAQDLIYGLEAKLERAAAAKKAEDALIEPGVRAGALRLGMSRAEAQAKLGPGACQEFNGGSFCDWKDSKGLGASFMGDRISNIAVHSAGFATKEGVKLGVDEAKLRAAFGAALETVTHTVYDTREDAMRQVNGRTAVEHWKVPGLRMRPGQGYVVGLLEVIPP